MLANVRLAFIVLGLHSGGAALGSKHVNLKDRLFQISPDGATDAESVVRAAAPAGSLKAQLEASGTVGVALEKVFRQPAPDGTAPQVRTENKAADQTASLAIVSPDKTDVSAAWANLSPDERNRMLKVVTIIADLAEKAKTTQASTSSASSQEPIAALAEKTQKTSGEATTAIMRAATMPQEMPSEKSGTAASQGLQQADGQTTLSSTVAVEKTSGATVPAAAEGLPSEKQADVQTTSLPTAAAEKSSEATVLTAASEGLSSEKLFDGQTTLSPAAAVEKSSAETTSGPATASHESLPEQVQTTLSPAGAIDKASGETTTGLAAISQTSASTPAAIVQKVDATTATTTSAQPTLPQNAGSEAKAAEKSLQSAVRLENEEAKKAEAESEDMVKQLLKKAEDTVKLGRDKMNSATKSATKEIEQRKKNEDKQIDTVLSNAKAELKKINNQAREAINKIATALTQQQMVQAMGESDKTSQAAEDTAEKLLKTVNNLQADMAGVAERTNNMVNKTAETLVAERADVETKLTALAKQSIDAGQTIGAKLSAKELSEVIVTRTTQASEKITEMARAADAEADTIITNFMTSSGDMVTQITNDAAAAKQQIETVAKELSDGAKQSVNQRWIANAQWMQAEANAVGKVSVSTDAGVDQTSAAEPERSTSLQSYFSPVVVGAFTFLALAIFAGVYYFLAHKSRMPELQALY